MAGSSSDRPSLTILGGPMAGRQLVLEAGVDDVLIGSDPSCGFHLPLPGVSPIHARLGADDEGVTIYDVNSPRGLYVNDDRVAGQAPLRNGDILWLGAPGDTDVVMIQCRVAPGAPAVAPLPPPPEPAPSTDEEMETLLLSAQAQPAPEPAPQTFADPPFDLAPQEPTVIQEPSGAASGFEVVADETPTVYDVGPEEASAQAYFEDIRAEPKPYVPPPPPPPVLPPIPAFFEDETLAEAPAVPPIPPPAPAEFETVAVPPPPAAPEPTVAMPPPPPAPRVEVKPAPPPRPAAPPADKAAPPARPPRPAPAPRAERPPRPAAPAAEKAAPPPRAKASSPVALYAGLAVVGALVVGGGIFAAMRFLKPSPPEGGAPPTTVAAVTATTVPPTTLALQPTAAAPTPETVTAPEPVEEAVTIVKQTPTPAPSPKVADAGTALKPTAAPPTLAVKPAPPTQAKGPSPEEIRAQQTAAQVADLVGQADAALVGNKYDAAAGLYDQALKLDPQNAKASAGRTAALAGAATMRKTFVAGRTTVQSGKAAKGGGVSGFDDADVSVAKAPDYSGRIEFEASPRNVKPGDSYTVKVSIVNDGKKSFKIGGLTIATNVNGARASGGPVAPPARDVEPQGRILLQDVPGVWQDGVNSWSMEVIVTSNRGDTFRNQLTWR